MRPRVAEISSREPGFNPRALITGTVFTLTASIITAGVVAALVYTTSVTETYLSLALYSMGLLTLALGGTVAARKAECLGWLHGGLTALISATLILIGIAFASDVSADEVIRLALFAFLAGVIGGIIGVNL